MAGAQEYDVLLPLRVRHLNCHFLCNKPRYYGTMIRQSEKRAAFLYLGFVILSRDQSKDGVLAYCKIRALGD